MTEKELQLALTLDEVRLVLGNAIQPARERFDPLKAPKTVALLDSLIKTMREFLTITTEGLGEIGKETSAPLRAELLELLSRELQVTADTTPLGLCHDGDPAARRALIVSWRRKYQHEGREVVDYLDLADRLERGDRKPFLSRIKAIAVRADDEALAQAVERVASEIGETLW